MSIQSILVATDLSAQENMAIQRASRLAYAHRATVKLMYLPPRGQAVPAGAGTRLANAASKLQQRLALGVEAVPIRKHKLEDLAAEASGMDLVVVPHRRERSTAAFFRGQPVLRLLRNCGCPVLVTRQVRNRPYRHILVAVDVSTDPEALVKAAAELEADAALEVFHAKAAFHQKRSYADLVVLGKRRTSAWEDFFRGSVAHVVLSWGSSDVLLVPQPVVPVSAPLVVHGVGEGVPALDVASAGRRSP